MASVYLSPSTQEKNVGAGSFGTEEKRMNEITDLIEPELKRHGLIVYRNKPEMTLKAVVKDSNEKKPDIHLAIHSNAFNQKARGTEVYCNRFGGQGEKLARAVYKEIAQLTPTGDRGVKESYDFFGSGKPLYELAYTNAPSALIEIAFHDHPEDAKWILDNIPAIAEGLVRGILQYFGITEKETSAPLYEEEKHTIQAFCGFSYPEGVWELLDKHPYAEMLYKKWAGSYRTKP